MLMNAFCAYPQKDRKGFFGFIKISRDMKKLLIIIVLPIFLVLAGFKFANSFEKDVVKATQPKVEEMQPEIAVEKVEEKAEEVVDTPEKSADEILKGKASYYADKYHGRTTANGETFDKRAMTAAHKSLPFNTMVKVTNLNNGKSVVVRINDRGPYIKGRIIDLSEKAAEDIAMVMKGVVDVEVEILEAR